jgi:hypothetical protein
MPSKTEYSFLNCLVEISEEIQGENRDSIKNQILEKHGFTKESFFDLIRK